VIKDSYGWGRTKYRYEQWKQIRDQFVASKPENEDGDWHNRASSMQYDLNVLLAELNEYEDLAKGKLELPSLDLLDGIGKALVQWKIAKGWTDEEVAERTGVDFVLVLAHHAQEFRNACLGDLIRIRDLYKNHCPNNRFDYYQEAIDEAPKWAQEAVADEQSKASEPVNEQRSFN
jgi:transcriptional regulator with XRE-family HTH domain